MSILPRMVHCSCGHDVLVSNKTVIGFADEDGFRTTMPTHVLVNCAQHEMPQTVMVEIAAIAVAS